MTEVEKILLTSSLTILVGVTVFVCGQIVVKFFIEPVHELRKLIGEIAFSLNFYANQIYGNYSKTEEAKEVYRKQACQLRGIVHLIIGYEFISGGLYALPPKKDLERASSLLIGLSNECGQKPAGNDRSSEIRKLLQVESI
jgi:hypothetical protein